MGIATAEDILRFWFEQIRPQCWWEKDPDFDARIAARFGATHGAAARCELHAWRAQPPGRLAEIIVLDQFSRNIYRDDPRSFACDPLALALAQEAVRAGADRALPVERRAFFYLPFTHSESAPMHEWAMALYAGLGSEESLDSERRHKAIIDEFGRYPHRNRILGRLSTPAELEFLKHAGSGF